ncbi:MAG: hypothetical protein M3P41_14680 [Actinomycetota bacterium]|nr:hypothetical protein [Actinomycetota bacterium]
MTGSVVVPNGLRRRGVGFGRVSAALTRLRSVLEEDALAVSAVAMWAVFLVFSMPLLLIQDSWLAFVDGRVVAQHWLPHVDTLTLWTLGRHWTDQQWGAHLVLYELVHHGGLRAAVLFGIGCVTVALALAALATRVLGASPRSAALGAALPLLAAPWLAQIRSQSFALVPFVALYALLALDARRPSRRVLWVLPLLAVWANLHGSVALGAGLVLVYGVGLARHRQSRARGALLVVGSPLCLLASPYGLQLVPYYALMLGHPPLAQFVVEWKPPAVEAITAVFFASAFAATALWGGHRRVLTTFERWALPLLLVAALTAVRNTVWFELAAAVSLPRLLDAAWPSRIALTAPIRRVNLIVGSAALAALAVCVLQAARSPVSLARGHRPAAAAAVAAAAGRDGIVLADDEHADWLLWFQPSLAGRVAYDVRFELYDKRELHAIKLLDDASHPIWRRCGSQASVVTFARPEDQRIAAREAVVAPGSRTIVRDPTFVAIAQTVAPNGRCRRL